MQEFPLGSVNIRVQLLREHMRVEVLNARHLKPPDPRSSKHRDLGVPKQWGMILSNLLNFEGKSKD